MNPSFDNEVDTTCYARGKNLALALWKKPPMI